MTTSQLEGISGRKTAAAYPSHAVDSQAMASAGWCHSSAAGPRQKLRPVAVESGGGQRGGERGAGHCCQVSHSSAAPTLEECAELSCDHHGSCLLLLCSDLLCSVAVPPLPSSALGAFRNDTETGAAEFP